MIAMAGLSAPRRSESEEDGDAHPSPPKRPRSSHVSDSLCLTDSTQVALSPKSGSSAAMLSVEEHPVIVQDRAGKWTELRCSWIGCEANAKIVNGRPVFFDGFPGFMTHLKEVHCETQVGRGDVIRQCRFQNVTEDEARKAYQEYVEGSDSKCKLPRYQTAC